MSAGKPSERSYAPFTEEHLDRLVTIARADQTDMFRRNPKIADAYRHRLLLIALCQGGLLHYVTGKNGVKDLDVYTFYARDPTVRMHPLRHIHRLTSANPSSVSAPPMPRYEGSCSLAVRSICS
jgi:hypothetical protein